MKARHPPWSSVLAGVLIAAVAIVFASDLAHATWTLPTSGTTGSVTTGTDYPFATDDGFFFSGSFAVTYARAKCIPCPSNCAPYEPQVNYSWQAQTLSTNGTVIGSNSSGGVQHWCECPTDPFTVLCPGTAPGVVTMIVTFRVSCGCCDGQGWVWTQTMEDAHYETDPITVTMGD